MSWWDDLMGSGVGQLFGGASQGLGSLMGNPNQGGLISLLQLLGMGSGAYSQQEQQNWLDKITHAQGQSLHTAQNPAAMNALIQKYVQGFTPTQNRAILGPVEQAAAARGQNQSPATMKILSEQALAPFANQQYQTAASIAENSLGLPFYAQEKQYPSFQPVGDFSGMNYGNPFGPNPNAGQQGINFGSVAQYADPSNPYGAAWNGSYQP